MGCANRKNAKKPEYYHYYRQHPCYCGMIAQTGHPCIQHTACMRHNCAKLRKHLERQHSIQCPHSTNNHITEKILPTSNSSPSSSNRPSAASSSNKAPPVVPNKLIPNQIFSKFEKACLQEHNILRSKHGCPPLALSRELCEYSQEWAKILLKKNKMEHRTESPYGENIYTSTGMGVDAHRPVHVWYAEIKDYDFEKGNFSPAVGHFTQLLWKSTEFMGVAYAEKEETVYVVANYDPPGNYIGQFVENVPPPIVYNNNSDPSSSNRPSAASSSNKAPPVVPNKQIPNQIFSKFEKACLQEHNILRSKHGCPPLALSRELCEYSQEWAKILLTKNKMEHRTESPYGENIYTSTGMGVDARRPVHVWYAEIKDYDFENGNFSPAVGHFTQLLWKSTKFIGVAYAEKEETVYVVANYDPPGNYVGEFVENVPPPIVYNNSSE